MKVQILLEVDVNDLDIDARVYQDSLTTEAWGVVQTDTWVEVEILCVEYKGLEVELLDKTYDALVDYLSKKEEEY